jgi:hypothetical protein
MTLVNGIIERAELVAEHGRLTPLDMDDSAPMIMSGRHRLRVKVRDPGGQTDSFEHLVTA